MAADGTVTPFLRRYQSDSAGTVTPADYEVDGVTEYTATGTVGVCAEQTNPDPEIASTAQRQTGAGTVTIPSGARSVTFMVFAGAPTVSIGGGPAVVLPAGATATWSVDKGGQAGESLQDEFVFTGAAGADFMILSTREV
ncbi:hypothetical protein [Sphaerimonospora mesophila]|uniref:hypothetical protein n=1 Tax=Sphaerimonospora mesophila TaxID=37483 RepID=UPI00128F900B